MLARFATRHPALRLGPFYRSARHVCSAPLIRIQDGTFYKQYPAADEDPANPPLYPHFNFTLPSSHASSSDENSPAQHWAVIGTSERTDLLEILGGQHICIPPSARSYPYLLTDEIASKDPRLRFVGNAIQYIGFSGEGSGAIGGTRGAYLSARYESHREETDWTVRQFLRGQTALNPVEGEEHGTVHDEQLFEQVIADLHLRELLDMPVANLSNGQTRRARIAKVLLRKPELLLLDDPFMGLDPATVQSISALLHRLAEKCAPRLVLALRPQDNVPDWITHMMILGNSRRIHLQGARTEVDHALNVWRWLVPKAFSKPRPKLTSKDRDILRRARNATKSGILDLQLLTDLRLNEPKSRPKQFIASAGGEPLIEMDGVRVQYGEKAVLGDWTQVVNGKEKAGLHWRVRRGQRWAILGANGSGKTTLLSLITSDHPQAYALPIKLFGRSRLPEPGKPGISIFDLQSRLGHSSPEIHAFFPRQLTVRQALESAFAETFLSKPKLDHERDMDVSAALRFFKAELDPNAAATMLEEAPLVRPSETRKFFPKIGDARMKYYVPDDYDVEYADHVRFGELNTAQQRIVLFLRALMHKPDIVILDEPFSGLSASQRDKCHEFLDRGERGHLGSKPRHQGLSQDQALVLISHVKEEIPDTVRHYMRLPSAGDGAKPLDFQLGLLKADSTLRNPDVWNSVWSPTPKTPNRELGRPKRHSLEDEQSDKQPDAIVYNWSSL